MITHSRRKRITLLALSACLVLAGCKEEIYSNLPENEVNEMTAILEATGVSSSRKRDKDGSYRLMVEGDQVAAAITVLKNEGLPKKRFQSIGEIFNSRGLVGSPFEKRALFIHALNEELSATITSIDGVREARVHIMIPQEHRFKTETAKSSASVAIHYEPRFAAQANVSTIKQMVAHSVPNLSYEKVAVALFEAGGATVTRVVRPTPIGSASAMTLDEQARALALEISRGDIPKPVIVGGAGFFTVVLLLWALFRRRRTGG